MAKCLKIAKSENFSFSYKYRKNTPNISKEIFLKRNCSVSIWIFEKKQIFLFIIVLKSFHQNASAILRFWRFASV